MESVSLLSCFFVQLIGVPPASEEFAVYEGLKEQFVISVPRERTAYHQNRVLFGKSTGLGVVIFSLANSRLRQTPHLWRMITYLSFAKLFSRSKT